MRGLHAGSVQPLTSQTCIFKTLGEGLQAYANPSFEGLIQVVCLNNQRPELRTTLQAIGAGGNGTLCPHVRKILKKRIAQAP